MKRYNLGLLFIAMIALLTGCSKETPFSPEEKYGQLFTKALMIDVQSVENIKDVKSASSATRADALINTDDFLVEIVGSNGKVIASYRYADMPSVITLPVDTYNVIVSSPENPMADWEKPYYSGSGSVVVKEDDIADPVTIKCGLSNVKVSVIFTDDLIAKAGSDCKVNVKIDNSDERSLDFALDETRSGYFALPSGASTLVAEFTGTVDENPQYVTRPVTDLAAGHHYRIIFDLVGPDTNPTGTINPGLRVDSKVSVENLRINIPPVPVRPTPGPDRPSPGPVNPPVPPVDNGPVISAVAPINLDIVNEVNAESSCKLIITSSTGITDFTVDIESDKLNEKELEGIGLNKHLDLVNPGSLQDALSGLGFPVGEDVENQTSVEFDISGFMGMLAVLGTNEQHNFVLTVTDSNGTTVKTLKLLVK